jgi:hypothetical protein
MYSLVCRALCQAESFGPKRGVAPGLQLRGRLHILCGPVASCALLAKSEFVTNVCRRGLLLTTFLVGKLDTYMVSGRTGKAIHLWRDENNFGGQTCIGQLLPGLAGIRR